jgi:hypothetical protein
MPTDWFETGKESVGGRCGRGRRKSVYTVDSLPSPVTDDSTDGRRIFVVVGVTVVFLAGLLGFFVGANGADVAPAISVLGVFSLPTTPVTMTLYGMGLAVVSLAGLFGLVTLASRFDEAD